MEVIFLQKAYFRVLSFLYCSWEMWHFLIFFLKFYYCTVCALWVYQCPWRGHRTTLWSHFSPSCMWVLESEPRSSRLVTSTFTDWAILSALLTSSMWPLVSQIQQLLYYSKRIMISVTHWASVLADSLCVFRLYFLHRTVIWHSYAPCTIQIKSPSFLGLVTLQSRSLQPSSCPAPPLS